MLDFYFFVVKYYWIPSKYHNRVVSENKKFDKIRPFR